MNQLKCSMKHSMTRWLGLLLLPLGLVLVISGCAKINNYGQETFSSTTQAAAIINGSLLQGKLRFYTDRTGTVSLESADEPALTCFANLRFTASRNGVMSFKCSDGSDVQLSFVMINEISGHARGQSSKGPVSLAYGMKGTEALAYLTAPKGKTLAASPDGQLTME